MSDDIVEVNVIKEERWNHPRKATIKEVVYEDGRIRYHVDVQDRGRDRPFVHQEFAEKAAAEGFLYGKILKNIRREVKT